MVLQQTLGLISMVELNCAFIEQRRIKLALRCVTGFITVI